MRVAFSLHLAGGYHADGRARPLAVALAAEVPLGHALRAELAGQVDAHAIARGRRATGSVTLGRTLRYALSFRDDEGRPWRLTAAQHLATRGGPAAFTVARGSLCREPGPSFPVELRFDPRADLRRLLASLSLRR